MEFNKLVNGVSRLYVPFEDLETSVFLVETEDGYAVIDCATYDSDAEKYIVPALERAQIDLKCVKYILLTHLHGDHSGGIGGLSKFLPNAKICMSRLASARTDIKNAVPLDDGSIVGGTIKTMLLPGHTDDCAGYYHIPSASLISGDCVQQYGIGRYGCGLDFPSLYGKTLERLEKDSSIENIFPSHRYTPLGDSGIGRENVKAHLKLCIEYDGIVRRFIKEKKAFGFTSADELSKLFKKEYSELLPGVLMLPVHTMSNYIKDLTQNI